MISFDAFKGWKLRQLDVKNDFLFGELDREIFMEKSHGFVSEKYPNYVCRLKKSIYDLQQSPRALYIKVSQYLSCIVDLKFRSQILDYL